MPTLGDTCPRLHEPLDEIETPAVVVDLDVMERNMKTFAEFATEHNVALRSHSKTHKIPSLAHKQEELTSGDGIVCQTLGEAEVMAQNGINNIYLSYMVVERSKLDRLIWLSSTLDNFATTVDCQGNVDPLEAAAARHDEVVDVIVEVDIGLNRVGVKPGNPTVEFANYVCSKPHINLAGLMAYEGHINSKAENEEDYERLCHEAMEELAATVNLLEDAGIAVGDIKVGSTGTSRYSGQHPVVTEINPGMYPFNDANVVSYGGPVTREDCALTVLTTIISNPADKRVIVDAGSKTMSMDIDQSPVTPTDQGLVYASSSEEHGWIDITGANQELAVGDRLKFIPPHVCTTVNLHDTLIGARDGRVEEVWSVQARGKVR